MVKETEGSLTAEERLESYLRTLPNFDGDVTDPVAALISEHRKLHRAQAQEMFAHPATADSVRTLCNKIWEVTHGRDRELMLASLCVLAGVAVSHLVEYAQILERESRD